MKIIWWTLTIFFAFVCATLLIPPYGVEDIVSAPIFIGITYFFYGRATKGKKREIIPQASIEQLYALALEVLDDGLVDQGESERLQNWFFRNSHWQKDYRVKSLGHILNEVLADNVLDSGEADEVFTALTEFCVRFEGGAIDYSKSNDQRAGKVELSDFFEGETLRMVYTDAEGNTTQRDIVFRSASTNGRVIYIKAFCLNRKAIRTFRKDRVVSIFSLDSGEILS